MTRRIVLPLLGLSLLMASVSGTRAGDGKSKDPVSKNAMDLRARKSTEPEFTKDTKKFGVEIFTDGPSGDGIYISEPGSLAVVSAKLFKSGEIKGKEPLWQHGLKLNVRAAGEKDWDKAKKVGLEVFKNENNGDLVYINETGGLGAVPATFATLTALEKGKPKNPTWKHGMNLKVRKAGDIDWDKAKKIGVEVFRDENNGNLIYLSETGHFAVASGKATTKDDSGKGPLWQHGLELAARKQGEKEVSKDTKRYGIEVFLDENNGNVLYICETGALAVVPGKYARTTEPGRSKDPALKHAMDLTVRKAGQKDFSKECPRYGIEVYSDENNGSVIYLAEIGDLAVVSSKTD